MKHSEKEQLYILLLADDLFFKWVLDPSEELNKYWYLMMQDNPENQETINELKEIIQRIKVQEEELSPESKQEIWDKIRYSEYYTQKKKISFPYIIRYVAAFILILIIPLYFYMKPDPEFIDYESFISQSPLPDKEVDNVLLVLGNKEKIEIKEDKVELIHKPDGRTTVNSEIVGSSVEKKTDQLNQLYVPYGKTTHVVLNDGSKIWVNSGSRLIYPSSFTEHKREIYVEGEIYLEVARDEKTPFIVKTDLLEVIVLGTSFNISAYKSDEHQSIVLVTGAVSVKETGKKAKTTIKPNQEYMFVKDENTSYIKEVDVLEYIGWKYGFISFTKESLSNVLRKIERYYNVPIHYKREETDHISVSGKLDLKENIEETFRIVSITAPIDYMIGDMGIEINVKP